MEKKVEQILALAEAGRFDVLDPQFRDDPAFIPYTDLWQKVNPEVRAQVMSIQNQWAELARYWGAVMDGERPAGLPPQDPWGIGELAKNRLADVTAHELAQMKAELESGAATKESMAAFLQRLDQRQEFLGKEKIHELIAQVFGEKGDELKGWLDFREQFVQGKAIYWHMRIEKGQDAAESWDRGFYQSLREKRDQGLHGEYAPLVAAIQAEAEALHNAYQRLANAKDGWWQAYFKGESTEKFVAEGQAAREELGRLDPQGAHWWNADRAWASDQRNWAIVERVKQAHINYWEALERGDAAGLEQAKARLKELESYGILPGAEPIRRIREKYEPRIEAVYLNNLSVMASSGSLAVMERSASWNDMIERELGAEWAGRMILETPGRDRGKGTIELDVPLLKQADSSWNDVKLGGGTVGSQGCTVTSIAMVMQFYRPDLTVDGEFMHNLVSNVTQQGIVYWYKADEHLEGYGLQLQHQFIDGWDEKDILKEILQHLEQGNPVILGVESPPHWVVVTGYNGTDRENLTLADFLINDPGGNRRTLEDLRTDDLYKNSEYDGLAVITRRSR
ncbi:MAG: C39 family peptidase [Symbiobacterium sp.]|uniref:C39 family peptidase n=1 Tax=Symbiobacterium sp. TaxID=1971213 RepID=UPI0034644C6E